MREATQNQIRLFALVILAFLPAVGLYVYANSILRAQELEQSQSELLQFGHVSAVEYQRLIDESEQLLGTLAEFPDIRNGSGADCNQRLASVLNHTPQYTTLTVIGEDGYLSCGALTMDGGLYLGDRTYFTRANATTRFSIGDYAIGRITGKPTLGVAMPLMDENDNRRVRSVLAAAIDLSTLGAHARELRLPEASSFTVVDNDGTILVREPSGRHPLGHDTVGAKAQEEFMSLTSGPSEIVSGTDLDGLLRTFAVVPLRASGPRPEGYLLVGQEEMVLVEQAEAVVASEFRFLLSAGLVLMIMAWLFGHYSLVKTPEMGWVEEEE